jgi:peptide/nickel transport system permease protein
MSTSVGPDTVATLPDEPSLPESGEPKKAKSQSIEGKSPLRIAWERLRRDKIAVVCGLVVLFFILIAVGADVIASFFNVSLETRLPSAYVDSFNGGLPKKGPPLHGFDPEHPFGIAPRSADDNLAYWLYGCRTSLMIATMATVVASIIGVALGLISGFLGGFVDKAISFVTDFFLSIPFLLAALSLAPIINERFASTDPELYKTVKFWSLVAILSVFGWMGMARIVRGEVLSLREREFVMAARVLGMPTSRILVKELLPNLVAPIVISVSLLLPSFVAFEAGLAFLGIGVEGPSWGKTVEKATDYFQRYPLYLWEPLVGIVLLVLALNLLGDAIRDALDPKTRR